MPAYIIAQLKFKDVTTYRRYQKVFPAVFSRFNAQVLAADEAPEILEGEWSGDKVVVLAFPDKAEAMRFHTDPEYLAIALDRQAGADGTVLYVHGWESKVS